MDLRYQSANLPTNAKITRFENDIIENSEAGVPAACYPPDADFLVRSVLRKDEVVKSYKAFKQLRENFSGNPVTNRFNVTWKEMQVSDVNIK